MVKSLARLFALSSKTDSLPEMIFLPRLWRG
jgi:hypothetical protein